MIIKIGKHLEFQNQTLSQTKNLQWYVTSTAPTININFINPALVPPQ